MDNKIKKFEKKIARLQQVLQNLKEDRGECTYFKNHCISRFFKNIKLTESWYENKQCSVLNPWSASLKLQIQYIRIDIYFLIAWRRCDVSRMIERFIYYFRWEKGD